MTDRQTQLESMPARELGKLAFEVMGLGTRLDASFADALADQIVTTGDGMLAVIEKMRERGYGFGLEAGRVGPWLAEFEKDGLWRAEADSAARAVAVAAILALEAK